MKKYAIPAALVAGAVVVWLLIRQIDKAKAAKPDVVNETLEGF